MHADATVSPGGPSVRLACLMRAMCARHPARPLGALAVLPISRARCIAGLLRRCRKATPVQDPARKECCGAARGYGFDPGGPTGVWIKAAGRVPAPVCARNIVRAKARHRRIDPVSDTVGQPGRIYNGRLLHRAPARLLRSQSGGRACRRRVRLHGAPSWSQSWRTFRRASAEGAP